MIIPKYKSINDDVNNDKEDTVLNKPRRRTYAAMSGLLWADIVESVTVRKSHEVELAEAKSKEIEYMKENLVIESEDEIIFKVVIYDYGSNIAKMYVVNDILEKYPTAKFDSATYELKITEPRKFGARVGYRLNDIVHSMTALDHRFKYVDFTD